MAREPKDLEGFKRRCMWNAQAALRKFQWNANRLARVTSKDTPEEIKAKFVSLVLTGNEAEKRIARVMLTDFADQ